MSFVYALSDPRTGDIRYIGFTKQTVNKRLISHLSAARCGIKTYVYNWIRELLHENMTPNVSVLETIQDGGEWQEREMYWIAAGRQAGWPLTNATDGGEGTINPLPETLKKQSERMKGKRYAAGPRSDEFKKRAGEIARITRNALGHSLSQEVKDRISQKLMGHEAPVGEANGLSKLTEDQVREIRALHTNGSISIRSIAKQYGISYAATRKVVIRETWKHVS